MLRASLGGGHCEPHRSPDEESANKLSDYQVTNTVRAGIKPDQCNLWCFPAQEAELDFQGKRSQESSWAWAKSALWLSQLSHSNGRMPRYIPCHSSFTPSLVHTYIKHLSHASDKNSPWRILTLKEEIVEPYNQHINKGTKGCPRPRGDQERVNCFLNWQR